MHYIDELIALYTGRDVHTRRYLLSGAAALPLSYDTDAIIDLLWRETASADAAVRHQARRELGRLVPEFVLAESGMHEMRTGVWTAFRGKADKDRARLEMQLAAMTREEADRLLEAGVSLFAPFIPRLTALIKGGSHRVKNAASLVLGRLPAPSTVDLIAKLVSAEPTSFPIVAAAAELQHPAAPALVRAAVTTGAGTEPDLIALLSALPEDERLPLLERLESASPTARWNVGQALAGSTTDRGRALVEKLVRRREGWTTAYALDAVSQRARERDLAVAELAYASESHEFLKVLAVKLAGHVISAASVEFLLARLAEGTPRVQAAAVEAMARQENAPRKFYEQAEALLASPLLRARVNAMMVLGRVQPERVQPALRELLFSDQAVHRLEAAYVLGYASGTDAVEALTAVAANDPVAPVAMQALKSLAKHPAPLAADRVLAFIRSPNPPLAATAVRAAVHQVAQAPNVIHDGLVKALAELRAPGVQGVLLKAIGSATARRGGNATPPQLIEYLSSPQSPVVQGALEGLKHLGDLGWAPEVRPLLAHADVSIRTRAALAGFLAGEVDALAALKEPLESSDEKAVMSALSRLLEAAVILPDAIRSARFDKLRGALQARVAAAPAAPPQASGKLAPEPPRPPEPLVSQWRPIKPPIAAADATRLKEIYSGKQKLSQKSTIEAKKLEDTSYMVGFPQALANVRAQVRPYKPLVAALAFLCVPLVFWLLKAPDENDSGGRFVGKKGSLAAGALRATFLQGNVRHKHAGKEDPLVLGADVVPGDTITTDAKGALTLDDGAGTSLWMGGNGHLTFATPPAGTSYAFENPKGDMALDFKKVSVLELTAGAAKLVAKSATFRIMDAGGVPHIVPGEGELLLTRGAQSTLLEKGRPLPFH